MLPIKFTTGQLLIAMSLAGVGLAVWIRVGFVSLMLMSFGALLLVGGVQSRRRALAVAGIATGLALIWCGAVDRVVTATECVQCHGAREDVRGRVMGVVIYRSTTATGDLDAHCTHHFWTTYTARYYGLGFCFGVDAWRGIKSLAATAAIRPFEWTLAERTTCPKPIRDAK